MLEVAFTNFCARLGDGTEVVHHVGLCHADPTVTDAEKLMLFVGNDQDIQVLASFKNRRISKRGISNFVEGIRSVRNELAKEDLLVGVEGVYER
jgi:hypothetical protein